MYAVLVIDTQSLPRSATTMRMTKHLRGAFIRFSEEQLFLVLTTAFREAIYWKACML